METLLNRGIKNIIEEYPRVADILESYDIGCVPCSLGTCLLKDIVEIHNLSPEVERELMTRVAEVVFPGQEVAIPQTVRKPSVSDRKGYSPPMQSLVDEHVLIKRLIAIVPTLAARLDMEREADRRKVIDVVDFIRSFADRFHHAKEEDVLFKYFDEKVDIIQVMLDDHVTGRAHVKAVVDAVESKNNEQVAKHLIAYAELLTQHIQKEDDVLYPWMDRELTDRQVGQMFAQFRATDAEFGEIWPKYEALIDTLERECA